MYVRAGLLPGPEGDALCIADTPPAGSGPSHGGGEQQVACLLVARPARAAWSLEGWPWPAGAIRLGIGIWGQPVDQKAGRPLTDSGKRTGPVRWIVGGASRQESVRLRAGGHCPPKRPAC